MPTLHTTKKVARRHTLPSLPSLSKEDMRSAKERAMEGLRMLQGMWADKPRTKKDLDRVRNRLWKEPNYVPRRSS